MFCSALLAACAHLGEQQLTQFLDRYESDPAFRASATGTQIWVTETTIWQAPGGFDNRISCTSIRSLDWFAGRGYRQIPTPQEAARDGLVVTRTRLSEVTADVTVGPARSEPAAIYSFYRDGGIWSLTGVEVFSRQYPEGAAPPDYRCLATESG